MTRTSLQALHSIQYYEYGKVDVLINMYKKFLSIAITCILTVSMASCSKPAKNSVQNKSASQSTQNQNIQNLVITGLTDSDIQVTADDLKNAKQVTKAVTAVDSAGNKTNYTVKGPLFDDILKKYGKSQKDLNGIRFIASDGYSIAVPAEVLKNRDIILAIEVDGKPLDDKDKPVRAVIPDERAMYWVKSLTKIEVLKNTAEQSVSKIIFLESASKSVTVQDYKYYDKTDKALKNSDLINKYASGVDAGNIYIKAADNLKQNEQKDTFLKAYIKFTGEDSPAFVAPDMPAGMQVKNVLWISYGDDLFFSANKGMDYLKKINMDGKEGVLVKNVLTEAGMTTSGSYIFTSLDGHKTEIKDTDTGNGIISISKDGEISTYFKGLPANTSIKGLLSIELKK